MLELKIVGWSDEPAARRGWRTESEMSLRYDHFLGDVTLRTEDADFTTTWGWVPVLDFAAGVTTLLHDLRPGQEETFEFTESEATLTFRRDDDLVEVTASYADGLAVVDHAELRVAAQVLLGDLRRRLQARHPDLRFNEAFLRMASPPEPGPSGCPASD
jgi:hypothetical protein